MADESQRLIVITGATRGLGRAMAEGFAALGHTVVGCGRSAAEVERLRQTLRAPHDFEAVGHSGTASRPWSASQVLKSASAWRA